MNINDIAKLAGVSPSTVSKVMNGRDSSISSETRSRVLEVARKYHYQPYSSVAPQASGRTFMLGALIQDMASDGKVVAGMLEASSPTGYSLLLEESRGTADGELRAMTALLSRRVDGIVWNPLPNGGPLARGELERSGVPALLLGNGPGGEFGIDFELIGYVATEALVEAGHTEVACIAGDGSSDALFVSGYRRCLFDHAIPQREDLVMMDAGDDLPSAMASRRFTAVVTSRYSFALRLCDLAKSLHYVLPQDLSLVSFFPGALGEESRPACSVVTPPQRELGRAAAQRIIEMVEGNDSAGFPDLPYEVVSAETIAEPPSQARPRVISVGSINIDNYLSFDSLPRAGTSTSTSRSSVFPGGKCANEAVGISKLGLAAAAIGMVGDDADADVVFGALAEHGVDADGVVRSAGSRTGQAYIFVDKTGSSMISIMSGANDALTPEVVAGFEDLFNGASACLLQTEVPIGAITAAATLARRHGALTVVKPSACGMLPFDLLAVTDVLAPNLNELDAIVPGEQSVDDKVAFLFGQGVGTVVVTMGSDGCFLFSDGEKVHVPALEVTSVDDTGAGDAFVSAFVAYLLLGFDKVAAARMATYAAGLSTTRQGVIPALVDRETLEAFVAQREPELLV